YAGAPRRLPAGKPAANRGADAGGLLDEPLVPRRGVALAHRRVDPRRRLARRARHSARRTPHGAVARLAARARVVARPAPRRDGLPYRSKQTSLAAPCV